MLPISRAHQVTLILFSKHAWMLGLLLSFRQKLIQKLNAGCHRKIKLQHVNLQERVTHTILVPQVIQDLTERTWNIIAPVLGTALPGFRSCKPPWLRPSERPWDHKPLRRQSLSPWQGPTSAPFTSPCLAPHA